MYHTSSYQRKESLLKWAFDVVFMPGVYSKGDFMVHLAGLDDKKKLIEEVLHDIKEEGRPSWRRLKVWDRYGSGEVKGAKICNSNVDEDLSVLECFIWSRWPYAEGEKEMVSHSLLQVPHWVCSLNFQVIHIDALTESSIAKTWSNLQTPRHNLSKTVIKFSVHSIYNSFWAGW